MRLLTLLPLAALLISACTGGDADAKDTVSHAVPVEIVSVTPRAIAPRIVATGTVSGKEEMSLSFKIGGIVSRVFVDAGERVRAGQVLAELSSVEIQSEVAKARQGRAKAERDLSRARALHADSVATLEQLQDATTAFEVANENVRIAEFNRQHAVIRAPTSGVVLSRLAEPNELVSTGAPVLTVRSDGRGVVLRTGLADRDAMRVGVGDAATVTFDALPGESFRGLIAQIAAVASVTSRTYDVEIRLEERAGRLASGLIGRAEIAARAVGEYMVVPLEALLEAEGDSAIVYLVRVTDNRASRRRVRIAQIEGAFAALSSGVVSGDRVITRGGAYVNEGTRVTVTNAASLAKEVR